LNKIKILINLLVDLNKKQSKFVKKKHNFIKKKELKSVMNLKVITAVYYPI
jgi:hypothetical protein